MRLDKILNTVFSFGAAVVIFGAWGKLEHTAFGDKALTVGLLTETAIFFSYGILEWIPRSIPASHAGAMAEQSQIADNRHPAHKEDVEALTSSIKETSNLLSRIFRV